MLLTQEERLGFNVNSKWINRFIALNLPYGFRIAFAEAAPGEDKAYDFHSAIVMTREDAKALYDLIGSVLAASVTVSP